MQRAKISGWKRDGVFLAGLLVLALILGLGVGQAWQWYRQVPVLSHFDPQGTGIDSSTPILIATRTCPACAQARDWLKARGIDYRELTADQSAEARAIARRLEVSVVPTFLIGTVRVNGFVVEELQTLLPAGESMATDVQNPSVTVIPAKAAIQSLQ